MMIRITTEELAALIVDSIVHYIKSHNLVPEKQIEKIDSEKTSLSEAVTNQE